MSIINYWNTKIIDSFLPSINKIKTIILREEYLGLPFVTKGFKGLKLGTVTIFSSWKGTEFGVFINTVVGVLPAHRQLSTLLLSDIILKKHIYNSLCAAKDVTCNKTPCVRILDDITLNAKKLDKEHLENVISKNQISTLIVYPFLLMDDQYINLMEMLKELAVKYELVVIMNMPSQLIDSPEHSAKYNSSVVDYILKLHNPKLNAEADPHGLEDGFKLDCIQQSTRNHYNLKLNTTQQIFEALPPNKTEMTVRNSHELKEKYKRLEDEPMAVNY